MRIQRITAAVIAAALLLTGCSSLSLTGTDILSPPMAAGTRAEVQRLISEDAKGAFTLIYPAKGDNKNGMILHDIDNDGIEEAVALYTAADNTSHVLVAEQADERYQLYGSAKLPSAGVSELSFHDFSGDGRQDILICFDAGTPLAALKAYITDNGVIETPVSQNFTGYCAGDFDGNNSADVLVMAAPASKSSAKAMLTTYGKDGFSEKTSCDIDPAVLSYNALRFDKISDDLYGAAADGKRENGECTTQLIYFDKASDMLVNPLFLNSNYNSSARVSAITCMDIDGDGALNIPLCSVMDHTKDEDIETVCSVARWNDYDPEQMSLTFKQDAVLCEKLGFMLLFGTEQLRSLTARYAGDNAVTLYQVTYKSNEPVLGDSMLTVYRYEKAKFDSSMTAQAVLYETPSYTYTYLMSENSPFTHEDITKSFMLLQSDQSDPAHNQQ